MCFFCHTYGLVFLGFPQVNNTWLFGPHRYWALISLFFYGLIQSYVARFYIYSPSRWQPSIYGVHLHIQIFLFSARWFQPVLLLHSGSTFSNFNSEFYKMFWITSLQVSQGSVTDGFNLIPGFFPPLVKKEGGGGRVGWCPWSPSPFSLQYWSLHLVQFSNFL